MNAGKVGAAILLGLGAGLAAAYFLDTRNGYQRSAMAAGTRDALIRSKPVERVFEQDAASPLHPDGQDEDSWLKTATT